MMDKYLNQVIGDYEVLERIDKKYYKVKCIKCGLVTKLSMQTLRDGLKMPGKRAICTCTQSGIKPGDKFGRLTVLYRDIENITYGRVAWICQCDCGNQCRVIGKSLKDGNTKSCGCLSLETSINKLERTPSHNMSSLVGERMGKLVVIRKATPEEIINRPDKRGYWLCQCDCGNTHIVSTSDFKKGAVQSCGCLNSKGEAKIVQLLENNNINYARQFYFDDLKSEQGRKYYFDFGVLDNNNKLLYLIEYDGIQHINLRHQFGENNEEAFERIQKRDNIKNQYCLKHNIPLIRIPYTQYDTLNINDLLIDTTTFLLKEN